MSGKEENYTLKIKFSKILRISLSRLRIFARLQICSIHIMLHVNLPRPSKFRRLAAPTGRSWRCISAREKI